MLVGTKESTHAPCVNMGVKYSVFFFGKLMALRFDAPKYFISLKVINIRSYFY